MTNYRSIKQAFANSRRRWKLIELRKLGHKPRCPICKMMFNYYDRLATVDHIIPRSRGGTDMPDNWQLMCKKCNSAKGSKMPKETSDA